MADIVRDEVQTSIHGRSPNYYTVEIDANGNAYALLRDSSGAELVGQKVMATSIPVTLASNQSTIPVNANSDPTQYGLRFDYDSTGDVVGTTDVTLFTFSGTGILDFVGLTSGGSTYEAIILIDGVEQLRIAMADLGSNLGMSNATNLPVWADTANKNFRFNPNSGFGFETSFTIKARSTTGSNTIKHITIYKEQV